MSYRSYTADFMSNSLRTKYFLVDFANGSEGRIAATDERDAKAIAAGVAKRRRTTVMAVRPEAQP